MKATITYKDGRKEDMDFDGILTYAKWVDKHRKEIKEAWADRRRLEGETYTTRRWSVAQGLDTLTSTPDDAPRKPWLYIGGNPGSGKTHICTAVCGELLKANIEVVYMQWLDDSRRLKAYVNDPDFDSLCDRYTDCAVLYIDDLFKQAYGGRPTATDADVRIAFTILNARYLENKPTIISSEWDLQKLIDTDEGTFSRVYERSKGFIITIPRETKYNYRIARMKGA